LLPNNERESLDPTDKPRKAFQKNSIIIINNQNQNVYKDNKMSQETPTNEKEEAVINREPRTKLLVNLNN
jgi:hypothetical protein